MQSKMQSCLEVTPGISAKPLGTVAPTYPPAVARGFSESKEELEEKKHWDQFLTKAERKENPGSPFQSLPPEALKYGQKSVFNIAAGGRASSASGPIFNISIKGLNTG